MFWTQKIRPEQDTKLQTRERNLHLLIKLGAQQRRKETQSYAGNTCTQGCHPIIELDLKGLETPLSKDRAQFHLDGRATAESEFRLETANKTLAQQRQRNSSSV